MGAGAGPPETSEPSTVPGRGPRDAIAPLGWHRLASAAVARVIGVWRLVGMAVTALVATFAAVMVIGPWGWSSGIDVTTGAPVTGPEPVPSVEPGVLYESPDGSLRIPDPSIAGDDITVRTDHGRIHYVVDRVRVYSKGRIADDATELFSQDSPGRLVLITCEDWDGTRYLSNVVVTALPD